MLQRSTLIKTVCTFACGLLFGYYARAYYYRRQRRNTAASDSLQGEIEHIYEIIDGIERQIVQIWQHLNGQGEAAQTGAARGEEAGEQVVVDGGSSHTRSSSQDDVFVDASESISDSSDESVRTESTLTSHKQQLFEEVDRELERNSDGQIHRRAVFDELKQHEATLAADANFWWRLAKAAHLLSKSDLYAEAEATEARKNELLADQKKLKYEAFDYAQKALQLDEQNGDCHKWHAITNGDLSKYEGFLKQASIGKDFKNHLDKARSLKPPSDPVLFHVSGVYTYKLSGLSFFNRKAAESFLGPINSTYEQALEDLLAAYRLKPDWLENLCFIGKTLIALSRPAEAATYLTQGLKLPVFTREDREVRLKLEELLKKC